MIKLIFFLYIRIQKSSDENFVDCVAEFKENF